MSLWQMQMQMQMHTWSLTSPVLTTMNNLVQLGHSLKHDICIQDISVDSDDVFLKNSCVMCAIQPSLKPGTLMLIWDMMWLWILSAKSYIYP